MAIQFLRLGALIAGKLGDEKMPAGAGINAKIDTKKFSADLLKAAEAIDADVRQVVRRLAIGIESEAVKRTPVDTGRARASWNTTEEVADLSVAPEGDHPAFQGDLSQHPSPTPVGYLSGEKPIYISNNIEYILDLEYGSSDQAPNGMARLAVAAELAQLQAIVDEA